MIKNGPSLQQCSFARGFYKLFTIEVVMIDYKGNGARRFRIQDSSSTEYRLSWNRRCFSVSWRDWWNIAETLRPAYVKTKKEDTLVTALLVHIKKKTYQTVGFLYMFFLTSIPQKNRWSCVESVVFGQGLLRQCVCLGAAIRCCIAGRVPCSATSEAGGFLQWGYPKIDGL